MHMTEPLGMPARSVAPGDGKLSPSCRSSSPGKQTINLAMEVTQEVWQRKKLFKKTANAKRAGANTGDESHESLPAVPGTSRLGYAQQSLALASTCTQTLVHTSAIDAPDCEKKFMRNLCDSPTITSWLPSLAQHSDAQPPLQQQQQHKRNHKQSSMHEQCNRYMVTIPSFLDTEAHAGNSTASST
jgi:hypothetical protein